MKSWWVKAPLIGLVSGFVAGLLGIGGGVIKVPGLVLVLGMSQYIAAGTSAATNVLSAATAVAAFGARGSVDWTTAGIVFIGAAAGALIGAHYIDRIPEHLLAGTFSLVMIIAAVRMFF
ncbi:MAG: TSUP family transporter [Acidimicrobiia bacterium]